MLSPRYHPDVSVFLGVLGKTLLKKNSLWCGIGAARGQNRRKRTNKDLESLVFLAAIFQHTQWWK